MLGVTFRAPPVQLVLEYCAGGTLFELLHMGHMGHMGGGGARGARGGEETEGRTDFKGLWISGRLNTEHTVFRILSRRYHYPRTGTTLGMTVDRVHLLF